MADGMGLVERAAAAWQQAQDEQAARDAEAAREAAAQSLVERQQIAALVRKWFADNIGVEIEFGPDDLELGRRYEGIVTIDGFDFQVTGVRDQQNKEPQFLLDVQFQGKPIFNSAWRSPLAQVGEYLAKGIPRPSVTAS